MKEQVGAKIRKLRVEKSMSQENVADELGITHSSYSKIERGETDPNVSRLCELAKILEVTVSDFFIEDKLAPSVAMEDRGNYINPITRADIDDIRNSLQLLHNEILSLRIQVAELKKTTRIRRKD